MTGWRPTTRQRLRLALLVMVLIAAVLLPARGAQAANPLPIDLGAAAPFGVLAGLSVANTGASSVSGDVGSTPGVSITGFNPPGTLTGEMYPGGTVAEQAQSALTAAYNDAVGRTADQTLTLDLAGMTLTPGVYRFAATAQLTGTVTLDAQGDPDAVFIFQIGSTLGSSAGSTVSLINGAQACHTFWQVGTSSTLGANTAFSGNLLADASITVGTGTSVAGRLLARTGTVTMDTNAVTPTTCLPPATTTTSTTGVLSISPAPAGNFASRSVIGIAQTTTAVLEAFSVSDPRGSGAGWRVTAHATRFTGPALRELAYGSLSMSAPMVAPSGTESPSPTVAAGPYIIDDSAPVSIARAAVNEGMGTYLFAATTLTLALPADVYADAYASTITISVVSGP